MKTLTLRLTPTDHALFAHLAKQEFMSVSSLIRRQMYRFAKEQGFAGVDDFKPDSHAAMAKGLPPRPREHAHIAWYGHTVYAVARQYEKLSAEGYSDQDIADWYKKPVEELLAQVNEASPAALTLEEKIAFQRAQQTARAKALGLPPPAPTQERPAIDASRLGDLFED